MDDVFEAQLDAIVDAEGGEEVFLEWFYARKRRKLSLPIEAEQCASDEVVATKQDGEYSVHCPYNACD